MKFIFWIRSSRGTACDQVVSLKKHQYADKETIRSALENWCSSFGAWSHSDNYVHYGYATANKTNLRELKRYHDQGKQKRVMFRKWADKKFTQAEYCDWIKKHPRIFPFK